MRDGKYTLPVPPGHKHCSKCEGVYPTTEFYAHTGHSDGLSSWCKACFKARVKEYQRNNPEKYRSWRSKYIEANRDQIAASARARFKEAYPRYRARRAQRHREWMQRHPEYARARVKRYRAMKLSAGSCDLTGAQWEAIKALYGYCCAYCGQPTAHLTQDHVVPLSRGGDHTAANVVPACGSCNSRKKDGPPPPTLLPLKFLSA